MAEKVARELGFPLEHSNLGRPPLYDGIKLAAAILVKGMRSFTDLSFDLKNMEYDTTVKAAKSTHARQNYMLFFRKYPKNG